MPSTDARSRHDSRIRRSTLLMFAIFGFLTLGISTTARAQSCRGVPMQTAFVRGLVGFPGDDSFLSGGGEIGARLGGPHILSFEYDHLRIAHNGSSGDSYALRYYAEFNSRQLSFCFVAAYTRGYSLVRNEEGSHANAHVTEVNLPIGAAIGYSTYAGGGIGLTPYAKGSFVISDSSYELYDRSKTLDSGGDLGIILALELGISITFSRFFVGADLYWPFYSNGADTNYEVFFGGSI